MSGLVPLFGAAALFWLVGGLKWFTEAGQLNYQWSEAADPMGWLYGAAAIGVESARRSTDTKNNVLIFFAWFGVFVCAMLLIIAMTKRGEVKNWPAPTRFKIGALGLTIAILVIGFRVNADASASVSAKVGQQPTSTNPGSAGAFHE